MNPNDNTHAHTGDGPTTRVHDAAFVRFTAPDLDEMRDYLVDFGLAPLEQTGDTLWMRATGSDGAVHITHRANTPGFVGLAFVATADDLDRLAELDEFGDITDLDGPQGGRCVTATDPNGFRIDVVADRTPLPPLTGPSADRPVNSAAVRTRLGAAVRLDAGPSTVARLGHCVLNVTDFAETERWYKQHFGLVTSDQIDLDPATPIGAFFRCDRGDRYVDHHTLFIIATGTPGFDHAAFEVDSLDDLMRGHTHLHNRGHRHQWGVGRHILGSQIYDYWLDPHGHMLEHWTDGDLFNNQTPPGHANVDTLLGSQWGPTSGGPPH